MADQDGESTARLSGSSPLTVTVPSSAMAMVPTSEAAAVAAPLLILYTRQGCCLCEGLEERLGELGLCSDGASPRLRRIDVDAEPALQARYGLEVPVLAVSSPDAPERELPRVPPRLSGERLAQWLARQGIALNSGDPG